MDGRKRRRSGDGDDLRRVESVKRPRLAHSVSVSSENVDQTISRARLRTGNAPYRSGSNTCSACKVLGLSMRFLDLSSKVACSFVCRSWNACIREYFCALRLDLSEGLENVPIPVKNCGILEQDQTPACSNRYLPTCASGIDSSKREIPQYFVYSMYRRSDGSQQISGCSCNTCARDDRVCYEMGGQCFCVQAKSKGHRTYESKQNALVLTR